MPVIGAIRLAAQEGFDPTYRKDCTRSEVERFRGIKSNSTVILMFVKIMKVHSEIRSRDSRIFVFVVLSVLCHQCEVTNGHSIRWSK